MKTSLYKIEKGIPIPSKSPISPVRIALSRLLVGDSFLAKTSRQPQISRISHELGVRVTTRKVEEGIIRVWRVKK